MDTQAIEATKAKRHTPRHLYYYGLILVVALMTPDKPAHAAGTVPASMQYACGATIVATAVEAEMCFYNAWISVYRMTGCGFNQLTWYDLPTQLNGYIPFSPSCGYGHVLPVVLSKIAGCPTHSTDTGGGYCTCDTGYTPDTTGKNCIPDEYTITLTGGTSTEPSQDLSFTATVANKSDGQPPTTPVTVKINLKVDSKSGGHDHGDSTRPRGGIEGAQCDTDDTCWTGTTDGSGAVTFNFNPTIASGTHTITATCDKCNTDSKNVDVKVDGLMPIPASQFYAFIGATNRHADNHYLSLAAAEVLWRIAVSYQIEQQFKLNDPVTNLPTVTPPVLQVNDASLMWGGKFDLSGRWTGHHFEHMRGTVVDVRANGLPTAIPAVNFADFIDLAVHYGADPYLESPSPDLQHFHLRLFNRKE